VASPDKTPLERLQAWAEDFDLGRFGAPHYPNPAAVKADVREALAELVQLRQLLDERAEEADDFKAHIAELERLLGRPKVG
jgi:hypothetical protein